MFSEIPSESWNTQMMHHGIWNLLRIMQHPDDASWCLKSLLNHETPRWCIMVSEISSKSWNTQMMHHGVWNLFWIMKHPDDASCCLRKSLQNHATPWDAHYLKSLSEIMKLPRCMVCEWLPDLSSVKSQVYAGGGEEGDADGREIINYTW
jgi:hypothetical protein